MKITKEISLISFEAWGPAISTLDKVIDYAEDQTLEAILEDLYPEGIDETQLNDILAYEEDWIFEMLGIKEDEDDDADDDDADDDDDEEKEEQK